MPPNQPENHRPQDNLPETRNEGEKLVLTRRQLIAAGLVLAGTVGACKGKGSEKGPGGAKLLKGYAQISDAEWAQRHMYVLWEIAKRHVPRHYMDFKTIKIKAKNDKSMVLQVEVAKHGLRVGKDGDYAEIPLDGPHSMAAAELLGCSLSTKMISEAIRARAFKRGGKVKFIDGCKMAQLMGRPQDCGKPSWIPGMSKGPNGTKMMGAGYFVMRNKLLDEWRDEHDISDNQLTSGYFKEVILDEKQAARGKRGKLATYPGYGHAKIRKDWRKDPKALVAERHPLDYFDYSHLARLVRNLRLNGKSIDFFKFHTNSDYATAFGFTPFKRAKNHYPYPAALKDFMKKHA